MVLTFFFIIAIPSVLLGYELALLYIRRWAGSQYPTIRRDEIVKKFYHPWELLLAVSLMVTAMLITIL